MDIQQGNVVTSKMMMQLRPGMTKSQVRFIMGTPLIQDSFHSNRWDYFYQMRQQGKIIEQRRVILEFENEALARVRGDVIPAGTGQQDLATPATTPESLSKSETKKEEKGLVEKLKFWKSDEEEKRADEQPAVSPVPAAAEVPATAEPPATVPAQVLPANAEPAVAKPAVVDKPADVEIIPVESAPIEAAPLTDAVPETGTAEATGKSDPAPAPAPAPVEMPAEPSSAPAPAATGIAGPSGESMQLMMDHSINLPADAGNPSNVSNPSQAPDADLPSEASPDYFERMLEKIGF